MQLFPNTTLIIGGASSGKTKFAEALTLKQGSRPLYIATAQPLDEEMKEKIKIHQQSRIPHNWTTIDAHYDLADKIDNLNLNLFDTVLVDCLTMWLTNHYLKDNDIFQESLKLMSAIQRAQINLVLVTNEVGYSVVPENKMAREFQKIQGKLNQQIALEVHRVIQVVAGIPIVIKDALPKPENEN